MPGNPDKEGKTGRSYQMDRRRYTKTPGYHGVLPRVFPCRAKMSAESAGLMIAQLLVIGRDGFALTSHPAATDGHVHLWLSAESAEYLIENAAFSLEMLEETK